MWFVRFQELGPVLPASLCAPVYRAEDGSEYCAYLNDAADIEQLGRPLAAVRLMRLRDIPGAAAGSPPQWHYVVATDVRPVAEKEFNAWYEEEHLPGLAAVPGTARAGRYRVVEGPGPRYHACYDLAQRDAFNSPAWLAVRGTPWADRVRPNFQNTRRTLYQRVT